MNNADIGIEHDSANKLSDIAAVSNNNVGITLRGLDNHYSGLLEVGGNATDCYNWATGVTGLDDSCANTGSSNATLFTAIDLSSSFVGKVISNDLVNTADTNGTADFSLIDPATFDWTNFANSFRNWGIDGSTTFPSADQRGQWTTGIGRIYDWSLPSGDVGNGGTPALLGVIPMPTGDDFITHVWDVSGATTPPANSSDCDAIVVGSLWSETNANCYTNYLRGASEIMGDGIGNDNALCESDESCLYTPNIGSYQGRCSLTSAGAFVDGTTVGSITSVTLLQQSSQQAQAGGSCGGGAVIEI
jgi:hypothetical protein